jgi:hypothetical protein
MMGLDGGTMPLWVKLCVLRLRAVTGSRLPRLVLALGLVSALGPALGACSKCAVPTWPQSAPQSCHSDSPQ